MNQWIVIVSPALADANNGNWQTARRWQRLLHPHRVRITQHWPDGPEAASDTVMLALHARRSAASIAAWAQAHATSRGNNSGNDQADAPGLAVVLTGTDLYRDIQTDPQAQGSLQFARRLVLLQERGPDALPPELLDKASVIFQSTSQRVTLPKPTRHLRAVMVGHLREEKSPATLFDAARLLAPPEQILIDHIGAPLDAALAEQAQATAAYCPHYRWLGGLPHEATRRRIQRAHVLIHTSRMEGGAHVVMEALRSGTPVLASRIDGNIGMLGADYAGYFDWNDAAALVALLRQCHSGTLLAHLQAQCDDRAPLFSTEAERAALHQLIDALTTQTNKN
jgi:putative glycosyltransferase (TIGR04348 family)